MFHSKEQGNLQIIFLFLILAGILLGTFLAQNRTTFLPKANTNHEEESPSPSSDPAPSSEIIPKPSALPYPSSPPKDSAKQSAFEGTVTLDLPDEATALLNKTGFKIDISKLNSNRSFPIKVSAKTRGPHEITKVELFALCARDNIANTQVYCKKSQYLTWFSIPLCGENNDLCKQSVDQSHKFTAEEAGMYTFAIKITGNLIEEKYDRNGKVTDRKIIGTDYCTGQFKSSQYEADCGPNSKTTLILTDNASTGGN